MSNELCPKIFTNDIHWFPWNHKEPFLIIGDSSNTDAVAKLISGLGPGQRVAVDGLYTEGGLESFLKYEETPALVRSIQESGANLVAADFHSQYGLELGETDRKNLITGLGAVGIGIILLNYLARKGSQNMSRRAFLKDIAAASLAAIAGDLFLRFYGQRAAEDVTCNPNSPIAMVANFAADPLRNDVAFRNGLVSFKMRENYPDTPPHVIVWGASHLTKEVEEESRIAFANPGICAKHVFMREAVWLVSQKGLNPETMKNWLAHLIYRAGTTETIEFPKLNSAANLPPRVGETRYCSEILGFKAGNINEVRQGCVAMSVSYLETVSNQIGIQ